MNRIIVLLCMFDEYLQKTQDVKHDLHANWFYVIIHVAYYNIAVSKAMGEWTLHVGLDALEHNE